MQVHRRGDGDPVITIIGSIHGDEPAGKNAIERVLEQDLTYKRPVQFIIANEKALEANKRYCDVDLNRNFPGDPDSDDHERRLAPKILDAVGDTTVLDLHTTHSYPEPFGIIKDLTEDGLERVKAAGVENVIHFPEEAGALNDFANGVVVETGHQQTKAAEDNAVDVIKRFLGYYDVIDHPVEPVEQRFYQYTETVDGSGWTFVGENFERVPAGTVFARKGDETKVAEDDFYPILMSTDGYENQIGFKARKIEPRT